MASASASASSSSAGAGPSSASTSSSSSHPASIFGTDPLDPFILSICVWIYHTTQGGHLLSPSIDGEVEIEAKLGTLIDTRTGQRVYLPVAHDVVLGDSSHIRFQSGMSQEAHRHFNGMLNGLCQPEKGRPRVAYKRHNEIDYFHDVPAGTSSSGAGGGRERLRVTKEADSLRTKPRGCVIKHRLGNLEVHCPGRHFDFRISVNLEVQAQEPPPDQVSDYYREKNRLSYTHEGGVRVDLTQVTVPPGERGGGGDGATLQHELEVELSTPPGMRTVFDLVTENSATLAALKAGTFAQSMGIEVPGGGGGASGDGMMNGQQGGQDWTEYEDAVYRLVNDVRLLIRNAKGR